MSDGRWRGRLPSFVSQFPADLAVVVALMALTGAFVLLPILRETPVRVVLAFPFLLFLPGYAAVAALYPERGSASSGADDGSHSVVADDVDPELSPPTHRIGGLERIVLSVGLSAAIVALTGLLLNFTPWGLKLVPLVVSVSVLTTAAAVTASYRRMALPEASRFSVPYRSHAADARDALFDHESRTDALLNLLLVVAVLVAATSVGFALVNPDRGEPFTEFYLLAPNEEDELLATDYPTNLSTGEPTELVVGLGNHENEPVEYTVVGELQRVRTVGNETTVTSENRIAQRTVRLEPGETVHLNQTVEPTMTGNRLRLVYLLYRDAPPSSPSTETAYRSTYLWVNVTGSRPPEG